MDSFAQGSVEGRTVGVLAGFRVSSWFQLSFLGLVLCRCRFVLYRDDDILGILEK
jgi:hypothetical protein